MSKATFRKIADPNGPLSQFDKDVLTRRHTAFGSFDELLNTHPSYRPTIFVDHPERAKLADAYDAAMEGRGDDRRAYRAGLGKTRGTAKKARVLVDAARRNRSAAWS